MIKRVSLFFLLLSTLLYAKQYDATIMAIEAKLFPKIALLEQHIKQDSSAELRITIFANEIDFDAAENFKTKYEGRDLLVKPMNCPGGMLVYKTSPKSYKDLRV